MLFCVCVCVAATTFVGFQNSGPSSIILQVTLISKQKELKPLNKHNNISLSIQTQQNCVNHSTALTTTYYVIERSKSRHCFDMEKLSSRGKATVPSSSSLPPNSTSTNALAPHQKKNEKKKRES